MELLIGCRPYEFGEGGVEKGSVVNTSKLLIRLQLGKLHQIIRQNHKTEKRWKM